MEFVGTYVLLKNQSMEPSKQNMEKVLKSINANIDAGSFDDFMSKVEGKSYEELLSIGSSMMSIQTPSTASAVTPEKTETRAQEIQEEESSSEELVLF